MPRRAPRNRSMMVLTEAMRAAAAALAQGASYQKAARQAHVHRTTVARWARQAFFQAHVDALSEATNHHQTLVLRRRLDAVLAKSFDDLEARDFSRESLPVVQRVWRDAVDDIIALVKAGGFLTAPPSVMPGPRRSGPTLQDVWESLTEADRAQLWPRLYGSVEHYLTETTSQEPRTDD